MKKNEELVSALLEILTMVESGSITIGALGLSENGYKALEEFYKKRI